MFENDQLAEIRAWADRKSYGRGTLNEALECYREWEPLKNPRRTPAQWVAAFKRICREGVEDGRIGKAEAGDLKPKGQAYEEWRGYGSE